MHIWALFWCCNKPRYWHCFWSGKGYNTNMVIFMRYLSNTIWVSKFWISVFIIKSNVFLAYENHIILTNYEILLITWFSHRLVWISIILVVLIYYCSLTTEITNHFLIEQIILQFTDERIISIDVWNWFWCRKPPETIVSVLYIQVCWEMTI